LEDEGSRAGDEGSGHGSSGLDTVGVLGGGQSGENASSGSTDGRLGVHVIAGSKGREGRNEATGGVGDGSTTSLGERDRGLGLGLSEVEEISTIIIANQSTGNDTAFESVGGTTVVVDQSNASTLGGDVLELGEEGASTTADNDKEGREIGGAIGQWVATVVGERHRVRDGKDGEVEGGIEREEREVGDLPALRGKSELNRDLGVVDGCDTDDVDTASGAAGVPGTVGALITSSDSDDLARGSDLASDDRGSGLSPARRATDGEGDDIVAILVGPQERVDEDIVSDGAGATEDTVRGNFSLVSNTRDIERVVGVSSDDTRDVGTVAGALIERVVIGNGSVGAVVVVANKIVATSDFEAGTEATAESGVGVISSGINDTNLDALAEETFGVELVNTSHDVSRELVRGGDGIGVGGLGVDELGPRNEVNGVDGHDTGSSSEVEQILITSEGKRGTGEKLIVELLQEVEEGSAPGEVAVQLLVGSEATLAEASAGSKLNDVASRDDIGGIGVFNLRKRDSSIGKRERGRKGGESGSTLHN
jgi:hypothetical protein